MAKKITISDKNAKEATIYFLQKSGYNSLKIANRQDNCDIIGFLNNQKYYFEVKYSSKNEGKFFGTVMLTELYHAISNKDNYRFIVCRGNSNKDYEEWFFKIFEVDEFIEFCTLTTPIFHYHLYFNNKHEVRLPHFEKQTVKATNDLIKTMWIKFLEWKKK